jgi:hypothetical protein
MPVPVVIPAYAQNVSASYAWCTLCLDWFDCIKVSLADNFNLSSSPESMRRVQIALRCNLSECLRIQGIVSTFTTSRKNLETRCLGSLAKAFGVA